MAWLSSFPLGYLMVEGNRFAERTMREMGASGFAIRKWCEMKVPIEPIPSFLVSMAASRAVWHRVLTTWNLISQDKLEPSAIVLMSRDSNDVYVVDSRVIPG